MEIRINNLPLIMASNRRLRMAIIGYARHRGPETKSEVYDALNQRRDIRDKYRFCLSQIIEGNPEYQAAAAATRELYARGYR